MAKEKPPVKTGGFRLRTTVAERRQSSFLSHRCTFFFLHGRSSLERRKPSDVLLINWSHPGFVRCHKTTSLAGHLDDLLSSGAISTEWIKSAGRVVVKWRMIIRAGEPDQVFFAPASSPLNDPRTLVPGH